MKERPGFTDKEKKSMVLSKITEDGMRMTSMLIIDYIMCGIHIIPIYTIYDYIQSAA